MDKKLIKDLKLVVWWALRLYTKRLWYVIQYGINYRKKFHSWYHQFQEIRGTHYNMGFNI